MSKLVICPMCGKKVSTAAKNCPSCGDYFDERRKTGKVTCLECSGDGKGKVSYDNDYKRCTPNHCFNCHGYGYFNGFECIDTRTRQVTRSYYAPVEGETRFPGCKPEEKGDPWNTILLMIVLFIILAIWKYFA